jgi:hypothetical protein
MGFGLVTGFTDHLQIVTIVLSLNYTLCKSLEHKLSLLSLIFTSRFLVMDPNSVLCLCHNWLANVSQLTPRLAAISHQPSTLLID